MDTKETTEKTDNTGLYLFIIIVVIIFIAIIIGLIIALTMTKTPSTLGESCNGTCSGNLVCDRGTCKSSLGDQCSSLNDCVSTATSCTGGICVNTPLSDVGGVPPCKPGLINDNGVCKVMDGGICKKNRECTDGSNCKDGICASNKKSHTSHNCNTCNLVKPEKLINSEKSENNYKSDFSENNYKSEKSEESIYSSYKSKSDSLGSVYENFKNKQGQIKFKF